jgi:undecaprenyl diphosphate synthase
MIMSEKDRIDIGRLPSHVAIIMDGNGRWAKIRGNQRVFGHKNGVKAVRDTVEAAAELGIGYLTLYAFSTENWSRPQSEVDALMSLLVSSMHDELPTLMENNVRLLSIGDIKSLPTKVSRQLQQTIDITSGNSGLSLILALSYSSRWEIIEAVKKIGQMVKDCELDPDHITCDMFTDSLTTTGIPDPELLIRTSGENRISNFLLWQIAYAELYFTPTLWPDFRREDFYKAIVDFQARERRFGKISEQVAPTINS